MVLLAEKMGAIGGFYGMIDEKINQLTPKLFH